MVRIKIWLLIILLSFSSIYALAIHAEVFNEKLQLAKTALSNQALDDAEKYIEQAVKLLNTETEKKSEAEVYYWFGLIMDKQAGASSLFSAMGYAKDALKGYLKSVNLEPENILYRKGLIKFYLNAPSLAGGDLDKAITQAKIILKQNTNSGYKVLIDCYAKANESELLLSTYKTSVKEYPLDVEFPYKMGVYWWLQKNYDQAVESFDLSLSLSAIGEQQKAIHLWSLYYIGRISLKTEKHLLRGINAYQKLINDYDQNSKEIIPSIEWVTFNMANLMELNSEGDSAQKIYQELYSSSSDQALVKKIKNKLY